MTLETDQREAPRSVGWNRLSLVIMGGGIAALVAAAVLFLLTFGGVLGDDPGYSGPETATTFGVPLDAYLTPQPSPTPASTPPSDAPIARIRIPKFGVDAPVIVLGLDNNNVMESPDDPCDVAWYDFTARPGFGSNAVFSGHVDWYNIGSGGCANYRPGGSGGPGPAIFYNLKDLEQGDIVEVQLEDGTVYRYRVASRQQIRPENADIPAIVGPTERDVVTLITCGGTFNRETRHYDQRVIVRAERIVDEAPGQAQQGAIASP